jgi:macrodomain Ter protein organizer (MatP/YcbG family)
MQKPLVKTMRLDDELWKKLKRLQLDWNEKTLQDVVKKLIDEREKKEKK